MGCKNRPFYQLGALPTRRRPNLLPDEVIGNVDPVPNHNNEIIACVDLKRLAYWTGKGVKFSGGAQSVLGLAGWFPIPPKTYMRALGSREKERQGMDTKASDETAEDKDKDKDEFVIERVISKKRIC
ncbi:unnamed protein product [Oppiella nova]|uniref:Small ribosomal subunit protein bS16m n=1 Tax=Oppiella nova TaxID=334625 RepID=A0A7R9MS88_9ACAR|nr:unnamed protein product [Oppiella nova]CAG2182358.1 unnamed protein product [Oppiella nova]